VNFIDIAPEDFGDKFHGVHIFETEDGDWVAYGHHSARRIAAAINAYTRRYQGDVGGLTLEDVRAEMVQAWGNNARSDDSGIWWTACEPGAQGAFPYTEVRW
jgi:hypothetical protein